MNLMAIDVNLVLALDALLREGSVTRAARRVGLSQPAMSHALLRLREALRDPLLVRDGRQMKLTERAKALRAPVATIVQDLDRLFGAPIPFNPTESTRTFRIAATDHVQVLVLAGLTVALAREAPRVALQVVPTDDAAAALRDSEIDLDVGHLPAELPPDLLGAKLFQDRIVGVARLHHTVARGRVDLDTYAALSHIRVAARPPRADPAARALRDGTPDEILDARGITRHTAVTVPHVLLAAQLAASTDLCATLTNRIATASASMLAVRHFDLPFDIPPLTINMTWHRRAEDDSAQAWLRRVVAAAAGEPLAVGRRSAR